MTYRSVQWRLTNYSEVAALIGVEPLPRADRTITVRSPDGLLKLAHRNDWIYAVPTDPAGTYRIGPADPNS